MQDDRFDIELLDDDDPFEVDVQAPHLFKHSGLGVADVREVWRNDPLFFPGRPPADWLMIAEVGTRFLMVPLVRPRSGDVRKCRPIGIYDAGLNLVRRYLSERESSE